MSSLPHISSLKPPIELRQEPANKRFKNLLKTGTIYLPGTCGTKMKDENKTVQTEVVDTETQT